MNERRAGAVRAAAAPLLLDGEQVELGTAAMIGQLSVKRMMAQGLVTAALTAGMATAVSVPKQRWIVLTNQRLLVLDSSAMSGGPTSKVVMEVPRSAVTCTGTQTRRTLGVVPTLLADLAFAGSDTGVRLTFPAAYRADGRELAAALMAPAS